MAHNGSGVYEVGAFKAQQFILPHRSLIVAQRLSAWLSAPIL